MKNRNNINYMQPEMPNLCSVHHLCMFGQRKNRFSNFDLAWWSCIFCFFLLFLLTLTYVDLKFEFKFFLLLKYLIFISIYRIVESCISIFEFIAICAAPIFISVCRIIWIFWPSQRNYIKSIWNIYSVFAIGCCRFRHYIHCISRHLSGKKRFTNSFEFGIVSFAIFILMCIIFGRFVAFR